LFKTLGFTLSKLKSSVSLLAIEKLDGGGYTIDSILQAIKTFSNWALRVGIALSGVALIIGFILYAVSDVDQKARVKQRIIQTMFGIVGIILAISIVNLIIDLF
jgi:hypothetical protein